MRSALVGRPYWVFIWRLALRLLGAWACAFFGKSDAGG
jgi:hypothetical protein